MQPVIASARFASKGIRGIPNEQLCPWDEDCWGTVRLGDGAIQLSGKRRMGLAGELLTLGPAQGLLKGVAARDLEMTIPVDDLQRVELKRRGDTLAFRVFHRSGDEGTLAHVFVTGLIRQKGAPTPDELIAAARATIPAGLLVEEGIAPAAPAPAAPAVPADWYADPSGRHELRYWDGSQWTEHVSSQGQQSTDPV